MSFWVGKELKEHHTSSQGYKTPIPRKCQCPPVRTGIFFLSFSLLRFLPGPFVFVPFPNLSVWIHAVRRKLIGMVFEIARNWGEMGKLIDLRPFQPKRRCFLAFLQNFNSLPRFLLPGNWWSFPKISPAKGNFLLLFSHKGHRAILYFFGKMCKKISAFSSDSNIPWTQLRLWANYTTRERKLLLPNSSFFPC